MNMTSVHEPDPARIAAIDALWRSRHAHHEAGHAVAAVAKGGKLIAVWLGNVDWSKDESADTGGGTRHRTHYADQPFVTFAGPWAEAMWTIEHDDDVDDIYEALEYAWDDNDDDDGGGGDTDKYEKRVGELEVYAAELGFSRVGRAWELGWYDELEDLWPAICEVAVMLLDGHSVTHEKVQAAVDRCRNETTVVEIDVTACSIDPSWASKQDIADYDPSWASKHDIADYLGVSEQLREIHWEDEEEDR
jgi:hypothetical protein